MLFYSEELKDTYEAAGSWPVDAVEVEPAVYAEFATNEAPAGKVRVAGADGMPEWGNFPPPEPKQILQANKQRQTILLQSFAQAAFPLVSAVALGIATDEQKEQLNAWRQYAVDLTSSAPEWPPVPAQS